jgi:muconolactone delta-isomerase
MADIMAENTLYFVQLDVGDVPKEFYQENGQREIDYTQQLIRSGKIKYLLVSRNRRHSHITFEVADEAELQGLLDGFPLKQYFTISFHEVMDLAEMVRSQS